MQGRLKISLVTEDVIINFLPVFKRLEDGIRLGFEILKKNMMTCFHWSILYNRKNIWHIMKCFHWPMLYYRKSVW